MANRFFNNIIDLFSGSKAKASDIEAHFSLITTGFNVVQNEMDAKAPTNSPAFTGVPVAPTPATGETTSQVATAAMVTAALLVEKTERMASDSILLDADAAWVSDTTYATGDLRYSPIDFQTYRRRVSGAGSIDPSIDDTNWAKTFVDSVPSLVVLTTSQAWVCPSHVKKAKVTVVGGGGGSGRSSASQASGAGGGGATAIKTLIVAPGTSYSITVGAGGAGGAVDSSGSAGGTSSISGGAITTVSASGGGGGAVMIAGGLGGSTISGHDLAIPGSTPASSPINSGQTMPGGASWLSGEAAPTTAGSTYGGGGGGTSPGQPSVAGAPGVVIIEY